MKITGSIMPSSSMNETSKITSDSSSLVLKQDSLSSRLSVSNALGI